MLTFQPLKRFKNKKYQPPFSILQGENMKSILNILFSLNFFFLLIDWLFFSKIS